MVVGNADGEGSLASFVITDESATAASGSPFVIGDPIPFSCRFSQNGQFVYTGGNVGNGIATFRVNSDTGVLIPGPPFDAGGARPGAYATDSSRRLFTASSFVIRPRALSHPLPSSRQTRSAARALSAASPSCRSFRRSSTIR